MASLPASSQHASKAEETSSPVSERPSLPHLSSSTLRAPSTTAQRMRRARSSPYRPASSPYFPYVLCSISSPLRAFPSFSENRIEAACRPSAAAACGSRKARAEGSSSLRKVPGGGSRGILRKGTDLTKRRTSPFQDARRTDERDDPFLVSA